MADHDGPLLISLTVAPPRPGDVVLAVQLINASGERTDGWPVDVEASGPGGETHSSRLTPCGPGCFKTDTPLSSRGVWRFDVDAQGHRAAFQLALPAPDGAAVLGQMRAAYNALRALQIDETFRSGTGLVGTTQYQYQAPDRSRLLSGDGREQITIGRLSYSRETQNRPWIKEDNPFPPGVPFPFIWSQAIEQPHLLPDAEINGRPVFVLALFDPFGIWFRVFVDKQTGRPIEDHMRAIGHFMDRTYSRFDRSIDIRAPT